MMKLLNVTIMLAGMLAISACTKSFRSDVATFHDIGAPGGESVRLVPINPDREDSLEFRQYAGELAAHLKSYGYKETGDAEAELIVGFDLTITEGREKLRNQPTLYSHHYWDSLWARGYYGGNPYLNYHPFDNHGNQIVVGTVYTATLTLELRTPSGELLFEGRAETETRKKALPEVMPFLAQALFQSFPGESGVTRRVVITPAESD